MCRWLLSFVVAIFVRCLLLLLIDFCLAFVCRCVLFAVCCMLLCLAFAALGCWLLLVPVLLSVAVGCCCGLLFWCNCLVFVVVCCWVSVGCGSLLAVVCYLVLLAAAVFECWLLLVAARRCVLFFG